MAEEVGKRHRATRISFHVSTDELRDAVAIVACAGGAIIVSHEEFVSDVIEIFARGGYKSVVFRPEAS